MRVYAADDERRVQLQGAVRDWVRLAVSRARATGDPIVFWLDERRPHDASLLAKVREYLPEL